MNTSDARDLFSDSPDDGWRPLSAQALAEDLRSTHPQITVLRFHAKGGMGAIYEGRLQDEKDGNIPVAIKVLRPDAADDADYLRRFRREQDILATLGDHPHIVRHRLHGTTSEGYPFLVMDWVKGRSLVEFTTDRPESKLTRQELLQIADDLCSAMQHAHENKVLHRDLKPQNIIITEEGRAVVLDFGIARSLRPGNTFTQPGDSPGTLGYIAPEVQNGEKPDERADIYSLGIILYQLLMKKLPAPFSAKPSDQSFDPRFDEIVMKAASPERERRYDSASELAHALRGAQCDTQSCEARQPEIEIGIDYIYINGRRIESPIPEIDIIRILGQPSRQLCWNSHHKLGEEPLMEVKGPADEKHLIWDDFGIAVQTKNGFAHIFQTYFSVTNLDPRFGTKLAHPARSFLARDKALNAIRAIQHMFTPDHANRMVTVFPISGMGLTFSNLAYPLEPQRSDSDFITSYISFREPDDRKVSLYWPDMLLHAGEAPKCFVELSYKCVGCVTNQRVLIKDEHQRVIYCKLIDLAHIRCWLASKEEKVSWRRRDWKVANLPWSLFASAPVCPKHSITLSARNHSNKTVQIEVCEWSDTYHNGISDFVTVVQLYAANAQAIADNHELMSSCGGVEILTDSQKRVEFPVEERSSKASVMATGLMACLKCQKPIAGDALTCPHCGSVNTQGRAEAEKVETIGYHEFAYLPAALWLLVSAIATVLIWPSAREAGEGQDLAEFLVMLAVIFGLTRLWHILSLKCEYLKVAPAERVIHHIQGVFNQKEMNPSRQGSIPGEERTWLGRIFGYSTLILELQNAETLTMHCMKLTPKARDAWRGWKDRS